MGFIKLKFNKRNLKTNERGQALVIVLAILTLGVLIITSSLTFIGTSIKTNKVYVNNTNDLYAAEAGVQDGIYNILNQSYSGLNTLFNTTNYSDYDYITQWTYNIPAQINTDAVSVKIKNIWVPCNNDGTLMTPPSTTQATNILNNVGGASNVNLIVTGGVNSIPNYTVTVNYSNATPTQNNALQVSSIGVWLPQGFSYNNHSSNLEGIYSTEQVVQCASNKAIIWTFPSGTTFASLLSSLPATGNSFAIQFQYSTSLQKLPQALAWINVSSNSDFPYSYSWNADIKNYDIISDAGKTEIETFIPKSSTRNLGGAISGDYTAIGNSLMTMAPYTQSNDSHGIRYTLLTNSSASVPIDNTKPNSSIVAAYLYWSGWLLNSNHNEPLGTSYGTRVNFKINGNQVYFNGTSYARGSTPITSTNNQTQNTGVVQYDYSYSCYCDVTTLVQGELQAEGASIFSNTLTFNVGPASGCQLADTGNEWSYAGWSLILIYSNPNTLGHQLYLYDTFRYADGNHGGGGNGSDIDPTGATSGPGGVISGFIVPPQITGEINAASFTAFVGEGDWCYSGDFVAFNAPSQYWTNPWSIPDPTTSHPWKLWDGITLDTSHVADSHPLPNNASQPDNVWNSYSQTGLSDGVDIKTFTIPWASGLLHAGDTSARIDLPTQTDAWNLVYMIFSFRSSVTSGGTISYLIRNR